MESIVNAFEEGGGWMYAILAVDILVIGVAIERTIWLFLHAGIDRKKLMVKVEHHVRAGEVDRAKALVNNHKAPLARVVAAGLGSHGQGHNAALMLMHEAQLMELPRIEARVGYLVMFSNIATLLGLLGTIVGLIRSFAAVASASAADKATELARGISEAMNCTAFGLIVAISALLIYAGLQTRAHKMADDVKHASQSLGIAISETRW